MENNYYVWLVAMVDKELIKFVQRDLRSSPEYMEVDVFIPTVKVLKKTFKGKEFFDEIPLLFNYGFFKVPRKFAVSKAYLDNMKDNISCIFSWLKDPTKRVVSYTTWEGIEIQGFNIPVAVASDEAIEELMDKAFTYSTHSSEELDRLKPGQLISLRGYPFDNVSAEIVSIDASRKRVKVKLIIFDAQREVEVSFDNVFYTLYHGKNYDDSLSTIQSLDELNDANKLDKKLFKNRTRESDQ